MPGLPGIVRRMVPEPKSRQKRGIEMSNPKKLIKFTGKCPSCHIQVEDKGVCPGCGAQFRADGTFAFKSRHKKGDVNDGAAKAAEKPQKAVTAEPQKPQPEPQKTELLFSVPPHPPTGFNPTHNEQ